MVERVVSKGERDQHLQRLEWLLFVLRRPVWFSQ